MSGIPLSKTPLITSKIFKTHNFMKYFIFKRSKKKVGSYPQVEAKRVVKYKSQIKNLLEFNVWEKQKGGSIFPPFEPRNKRTILTDVLSSYAVNTTEGLFIKESSYESIREFFPKDTVIMPIDVHKNAEVYQYLYVYLNEINNDYIDFDRSLFYRETTPIQPPQPAIARLLKVKDAKEYYQLVRLNDDFVLKYHQLFLDEKKINKHVFRLRGTFGGLIFSEELVQACKKLKMTGIEFQDVSELYCSKKYIAGHYLLEV